MEKISVIIPVKKDSIFIHDCLQSIIKSTYRNIEIILVDDGTAPDMEAVFDSYQSNTTVLTKKYINLAAARNYGFKSSSGTYVAFFNADDVNGKMRFELSVKKLEENPQVGMVFCGTTFINEKNEFLTGIGRFPKYELNQFHGYMLEHNWIDTVSTTLIRASLLDKIGGFDESFPAAEDYDLFLRIGAVSQVVYIDLPLLRFRHRSQKIDFDGLNFREYEIKALQKLDPGEIAVSLSFVYDEEGDFRISFGKVLYKMGLKEKALQQFQRSVNLNNKCADGHYYSGNCYFDLYNLNRALMEYKACLKLNNNHVECRNNLGILYFRQGKHDLSMSEFKKAASLTNIRLEPLYNLSCVEKSESPEVLRFSPVDVVRIDNSRVGAVKHLDVRHSVSV